jgi:hypothetical protein
MRTKRNWPAPLVALLLLAVPAGALDPLDVLPDPSDTCPAPRVDPFEPVCVGSLGVCNEGIAYDPDRVALCAVAFNPSDTCPGGAVGFTTGPSARVCGVPVDPSACTTEFDASAPAVCGVPLVAGPCATSSTACGLLERCIDSLSMSSSPAPCGEDPFAVCRGTSDLCALAADCLAGGVAYPSADVGGVRVCGEEADPCVVILTCNLDCLTRIGESDTGTVCGVDLPCGSIDVSTWGVCGIVLDPCAGHDLCSNPCVEEILHFAAEQELGMGSDSSSTRICGLTLPETCHLLSDLPENVASWIPATVPQGMLRQALKMTEGLHAGPLSHTPCATERCTDTPPFAAYENGDCPCLFFPATFYDMDGDGSVTWPALDDDDADCDQLANDLENDVSWLFWLRADPNWLMTRPDEQHVKFRVAMQKLTWLSGDKALLGERDQDMPCIGCTSDPDPYLKLHMGLNGPSSADYPMWLLSDEPTIPGFNKTSHPWDVGVSHGFEWDVDGMGWSHPRAEADLGADAADVYSVMWGEREGGVPKIHLPGLLWEDDAGSRDRGADDVIGDPFDYPKTVNQIAEHPTQGLVGWRNMWYLSRGTSPVAELQVSLGISLGRCAIAWSSALYSGADVVTLSDISSARPCE